MSMNMNMSMSEKQIKDYLENSYKLNDSDNLTEKDLEFIENIVRNDYNSILFLECYNKDKIKDCEIIEKIITNSIFILTIRKVREVIKIIKNIVSGSDEISSEVIELFSMDKSVYELEKYVSNTPTPPTPEKCAEFFTERIKYISDDLSISYTLNTYYL